MHRQWEVDLLRCITVVQEQVIDDVDARIIFDKLLSHLLELTGSEYGFIGEVLRNARGAPYLRTRAITNIAWNEETRAFYDEHAPRGLEFHNMATLFGAAIVSERPVIANSPASDPRSAGCPAGHPELRAFLGLPFHRRDRLIGMVGIANRPGGYDEKLVSDLRPFLSACASTIEAFTNQREREKAEKALRASEDRYRRLVEDQPELLCRFTPDRSLTFVNRAYAEYFGKTISECDGLDFLELIPESDHEAVREHFASLSKDRPTARQEHQVIGADGLIRWIQWTNRALLDGNGEIFEIQSLGLDITGRKRAEDERRALETQLRQVQKLESLGILAGGIAHDFNNLLTGILGNASLTRAELPAGSPAAGYVEQIETASLRAAELCSQMLAYSGQGRFETRSVDLSALVREMVQMLQMSISKKVVVELELADEIPAVDADETQMSQVVMNLITNASEAHEGRVGTVRVTTGVRHCDTAFLRGSYIDDELPEGRYVFVEVTDSGAGMESATVARIFDPFFSTKFAGRGLGLAAVLGIVRGHRGAIRVGSRPGSGTTVTVLFPASTRVPAAAHDRPPETAAHDRPPETAADERSGLVLVIDDEEIVRELARSSLESSGFDVLTATNGREGLDLFRERMDEISVVLVDLTMPELGGDEVLREIRRTDDGVRVILSSGYSEHDVAGRLASLKPFGFLQKPYRPVDLVAAVDASLVRPG